MIWVCDEGIITGYVPVFDKEYTEEEIRKMSFFLSNGWSKLSRFVMEVQGIKYSQFTLSKHYKVEVKKLIDVTCDFNFECFYLTKGAEREQYFNMILDVVSHLTLVKICEYKEEKVTSISNNVVKQLSNLVTSQTLNDIHSDIENLILSANNTRYHLRRIMKHNFNSLFRENVSKEEKDKFYVKRKAIKDFTLSF